MPVKYKYLHLHFHIFKSIYRVIVTITYKTPYVCSIPEQA